MRSAKGIAAAIACSISRRATIQVARFPALDRAILPHAPVRRIVFVQLDFLGSGQGGHAVRGDRRSCRAAETAAAHERNTAARDPGPLQPDQAERQDAVDRGGILVRATPLGRRRLASRGGMMPRVYDPEREWRRSAAVASDSTVSSGK